MGNKGPKVYVISVPAGGGGKTTISGNGASYLSEKANLKTLLIDLDQSCSLTDRIFKNLAESLEVDYLEFLDSIDDDNDTVKSIFKGGNPSPIQITDNLDFIPGCNALPKIASEVEGSFSWNALYLWMKINKEVLSIYERIIIDTHNDEIDNIYLTSSYIIADKVVFVLPVDETVIKKVSLVEERLALLKLIEEDKVKAEMVVVGNKFVNNPSKEVEKFQNNFKEMMAKEPEKYIGYFETRKYLSGFKVSGKTIVELESTTKGKTPSDIAFLERTWEMFGKLFDVDK
ncbi:TPA: ParA family protein [Streptococcus agalactiae]|nr:ParA family protein [Streptococcus agalactiae]HEO4177391.1 ParA family protein [Streptococcus agalactiae]